jgi:hypothetical protein
VGCWPGSTRRPRAAPSSSTALPEDPAFLAEVGFLTQEIPLYRRMSAEDRVGIGAHRILIGDVQAETRGPSGSRPAVRLFHILVIH